MCARRPPCDPNFRPPGTSPQVSECCPVGDELPDTAYGSSCLCVDISNLAQPLVILEVALGRRSHTHSTLGSAAGVHYACRAYRRAADWMFKTFDGAERMSRR